MNVLKKMEEYAMIIAIVLTVIDVVGIAFLDIGIILDIAVVITVIFEILYLKGALLKFIFNSLKKSWQVGWNIGSVIRILPFIYLIFGLMGALFAVMFAAIFVAVVVLFLPIVPVLWYCKSV